MIKIFIPGVLPSLNKYILAERGNRYAGARMKDEATEKCARAFMFQSQSPGAKRIGPITYIWHHPNRMSDLDNVAFCQKFVLDGMVRSGFIGGDGWSHRVPEEHHYHIVDKEKPGVEVMFSVIE